MITIGLPPASASAMLIALRSEDVVLVAAAFRQLRAGLERDAPTLG
jgi:hypothetical protein